MAIPAAELAAMQATLAATALDQSGLLQRNTPTATNYGTQTDSWSTGVTVACSIAKPSANLAQQYAAKIGTLAAWVIRVPVGTDIRDGDQITIGGVVMRVNAVFTPRSYAVALQALVVELQ